MGCLWLLLITCVCYDWVCRLSTLSFWVSIDECFHLSSIAFVLVGCFDVRRACFGFIVIVMIHFAYFCDCSFCYYFGVWWLYISVV